MRLSISLALLALVAGAMVTWAGVPTNMSDYFLPGSQPLQSETIETPTNCDCHGGYNESVEPMYNWVGSMMAQATRDPLFLATMTIANQVADSSGDLCLRCHTPKGWLEGRSEPTDGSSLTQDDFHGLVCHFCHKMVTPSPLGVNPYPGDADYAAATYAADQDYLDTLAVIPAHTANGMYVVSDQDYRRGPYSDLNPPHDFYYSPFHSTSGLCGTCHDVSNPVFTKDANGKYIPNDFGQPAPDFSPYSMFPVERTFSEWLKSAYNTPEGVYAPQFGGNKDTVSSCQDCHMRDITGKGAQQGSVPTRTDLGLHDLTGGNTFVPEVIKTLFPEDVDTAALTSGIDRATYMLENAATMSLSTTLEGNQNLLTVTVTNETGHKLPSGYPEGRRIWLNVRAYDSTGVLRYESGAYDLDSAVLTHDTDAKIYEIKPGISGSLSPVVGYPAGPSFHFVLNDSIYKDNRIPPRGFTNAAFDSIQSPPVAYSYPDGQYWDETDYLLPGPTAKVVVTLYYQTTSKEYVEFLRDENATDSTGQLMYDTWDAHGRSAPMVMEKDSVDVTPQGTNQIPILAPIGPRETDEGVLLSFTISGSDPDGTTPDLSTSTLPDGAQFVDSGNGVGSFSWTPGYDQAGTYQVIFYATDEHSAVDSEEVQITVNNINQAPTMASVDPQTVTAGGLLQFLVNASDPDGTIPSIVAENLPTNATFADSGNGTGLFEWATQPGDTGLYTLRFVASDGDLADSTEVQVSVQDVCCVGRRGNVDGVVDGGTDIDIGDLVWLVDYMFTDGPPPPCIEEGNIDASCCAEGSSESLSDIDISDLVYLVDYMFTNGPEPPSCP